MQQHLTIPSTTTPETTGTRAITGQIIMHRQQETPSSSKGMSRAKIRPGKTHRNQKRPELRSRRGERTSMANRGEPHHSRGNKEKNMPRRRSRKETKDKQEQATAETESTDCSTADETHIAQNTPRRSKPMRSGPCTTPRVFTRDMLRQHFESRGKVMGPDTDPGEDEQLAMYTCPPQVVHELRITTTVSEKVLAHTPARPTPQDDDRGRHLRTN